MVIFFFFEVEMNWTRNLKNISKKKSKKERIENRKEKIIVQGQSRISRKRKLRG